MTFDGFVCQALCADPIQVCVVGFLPAAYTVLWGQRGLSETATREENYPEAILHGSGPTTPSSWITENGILDEGFSVNRTMLKIA